MNGFVMNQQEKTEDKIATLPTGNQAVPTTEPDWDYYYTAKERAGSELLCQMCLLKDSGNHTLKL